MPKVTIVGAGHVGMSTALFIAKTQLADIVLIDVLDDMARLKAEDALFTGPLQQYESRIQGSRDVSLMADSDIVVITAGKTRTPGMSRDDLLQVNTLIVRSVAEQVKTYSPAAFVIVVTNPLDAMAYVTLQLTGFQPHRVMGMAGILDSTRFQYFIAEELGVHVTETSALVLGSHGDSMVPLSRYTTVGGIPVTEFLDEAVIERLVERTRNGGSELVGYLKTGSAFWAAAASITEMVTCILTDHKRILPCSAYLNGQYGIRDIFIGVPVQLGKDGIEDIVELELTAYELAQLRQSAGAAQETIDRLKEVNLCCDSQ